MSTRHKLARMKLLLPIIASTAFASAASAADAPFYIGTYTKPGGSEGIYAATLDTETGKLGPVKLAGKAASPSYLAMSPDGKFLYAAIEDGEGAVAAFAVGAGAKLTALNQKPSGGSGTCHISTDATGRTVLAANYGGGNIAGFRVKDDGSLGERSAFVQYEGTGPNKERQEKPHAHSIATDPANKLVYSCDLGTDHIWIFQFDPKTGTLTPNNPASDKVPPGAGPRHFAIHPNGRFAYVNNEMGLSVTAFTRDAANGALTAIQTLPSLPAGTPPEGVSTAEAFCHPTGKWLYVSNRGHNTIAVYAIAEDGKLTWIENANAQVKVPRGFAIDPSGKWLIAAGQEDNKLAVLKIDATTGHLTPAGSTAEVSMPVCILFAR